MTGYKPLYVDISRNEWFVYREAEWIYKKGFTEPTLTQQRGYLREECEQWKQKTATVEKIKKALDFMRQQFLEVP